MGKKGVMPHRGLRTSLYSVISALLPLRQAPGIPELAGRSGVLDLECPEGSGGKPRHLVDCLFEVPISHIHCSAQQIFMPCTEVGISSGSKSPIIFVLSCGVSGPLTRELLNSSSLALFLLPVSLAAPSRRVDELQLFPHRGGTKSCLPASRPTIISRAHLRP